MESQNKKKQYYVCPKCANYVLSGRNVLGHKCSYCSAKLIPTEIAEPQPGESAGDVLLEVMKYIETKIITGSQYDMMSSFLRTTKDLDKSISDITSEISSINTEAAESQKTKAEVLSDFSAKLAVCPNCGLPVISVNTQSETGKTNHCSSCNAEWKTE